jgi:hypothetical protein
MQNGRFQVFKGRSFFLLGEVGAPEDAARPKAVRVLPLTSLSCSRRRSVRFLTM